MKTQIVSSTIFQAMEELAPKNFAYDWDNVGLQIGSYDKKVNNVMITLDVMESTVDEAIKKKVDLIIAHHPLLFTSISNVNTDSPQGRIITKLIKHDICVYASHTNLDSAPGGVNDQLGKSLGIESRKPFVDVGSEGLYKVVVFVPETHQSDVRNALSKGGAGHIGNYSHCTFQTKGEGTFKPLVGSKPYVGSENQLALVDEIKIETIVPESQLTNVIKLMIEAHPYEEVAYDTYSLFNKGDRFGLGRIGSLNIEMSLKELCDHVKNVFDLDYLRVVGNLKNKVRKIAVLGGSGEKYIKEAKQAGADAYITGDVTFHQAQHAWQMGLSVIDAGHYIEQIMKSNTKKYLNKKFDKQVNIIVSEVNTDPFQFI